MVCLMQALRSMTHPSFTNAVVLASFPNSVGSSAFGVDKYGVQLQHECEVLPSHAHELHLGSFGLCRPSFCKCFKHETTRMGKGQCVDENLLAVALQNRSSSMPTSVCSVGGFLRARFSMVSKTFANISWISGSSNKPTDSAKHSARMTRVARAGSGTLNNAQTSNRNVTAENLDPLTKTMQCE